MRVLCAVAALALAGAAPLAAQEGRKCLFKILFVGDTGHQVPTIQGTNYFAGGGVRLTCAGTRIFMESDSLASYGGTVVQFIGNVKYRDSTLAMDADNGTYYKDGERWEARGKVHTVNLATGSTLDGPSLDYFRVVKGVRDTAESYAVGRPTIRYYPKGSRKPEAAPTDSAGKGRAPADGAVEPYVIIGDRIREKGEDQVWAGGKVTIDRSDLTAHGDSLWMRTGKNGKGALIGGDPAVRGFGKDTFDIKGKQIDFTLDEKDLTGIAALDSAHAVTKDVDLVGDTVSIALLEKKPQKTEAWGRTRRPIGLAGTTVSRGDSLAIDTPAGDLREVRAFINAWAGTKPDSGTGERDWVAGDTVIVSFVAVDSAGSKKTRVRQIEASDSARSFYRAANKDSTRSGTAKPAKAPSLNYARADRIVMRMSTGDDAGLERVDLFGHVDGIQLEPDASKAKPAAPGGVTPARPGVTDTTKARPTARADSIPPVKADSTTRAAVPAK